MNAIHAMPSLAVLSALVMGGLAPAAAQARLPAAAGIDGITAERIVGHIGVLADDSLRGRGTPSPGLDAAARYVARQFELAGLHPVAGGGLVVRWPLVVTHRIPSRISLEAHGARSSTPLVYGTDFAVMPAGIDRVTGKLVAVSDLSDTAAVRGRIPVLRLPPGDWRGPAHTATFAARRAGAAGLVVVLDSAQMVAPVAAAGVTMDHAALGVPTALLTPAAARRLEGTAGRPAGEVTLAIPQRADTTYVPYVVGVLEGSDPALRDQYVVVTAHLDHLGVGAPDERGDSIYNGADDNASGVAAVVEAAHAFAGLVHRPRRSVIFFVTSAEELCICGSEYFTRTPPVPVGALVADVNFDGIGRSWQRDTVSAEGSAYSTLGSTVREVARAHPELRWTVVDDQWPDHNYFSTSDQIWFARRGVPSLFLSSTGPDAHYHRPSDEASTIDGEVTARVARLGAWLALAVADAPERPRWDAAARRTIVIER